MRIALAIFVKTPGISPVKTRLAKGIGVTAATEFYRRCLTAVESVVSETVRISRGLICPFWAVGEPHTSDLPLWRNFPVLYTGPGGLGQRLHTIYSELIRDYDSVFMMGSDSPQVTPALLVEAASRVIESDEFVIGPARDGGFYLLGGSRAISRQQFTAVRYSQADTAEKMIQALSKSGKVHLLSELTDVDRLEDIAVLQAELKSGKLPAQRSLMIWLEENKLLERRPHAD
ncbi:MAG: glycosyltransferase [FCB group bacterium]|nr:glycosyltransferase [FCB group bacterium]